MMQPLSADAASGVQRTRNWWAEILLVLGVLGFGYFAVMLDKSPEPAAETQAPSTGVQALMR